MQPDQAGFDFAAFAGSLLDAVILADSAGFITYVNRVAVTMLGYSAGELMGQQITALMPERYRDAHVAGMERVRKGGAPKFTGHTLRLHGLRKDGTEFPIELSLSSWQTPQGPVFSGILRDVTAAHEAESMVQRTLRESERRFNIFMAHAPLVAFIKDSSSRYIWINEELERRFGFKLDEIRGKTDVDIFDIDTAAQNMANDQQVLEGGRPIDSSATIVAPDGLKRSWLMIKFPLELSSGTLHIGGVGIDVTERSALEQQLERSERISGLGRVAASIAHEINNVLMGILPFAELVMRRSLHDEVVHGAAANIIQSVERGKHITQEILEFTRGADPVVRPINCVAWLGQIEREIAMLLGNGLQLEVIAPDPRAFVRGDPMQLHQVLANLTLNARDAMHGAGKLTITASDCEPGGTGHLGGCDPGGSVHLTVEDTGSGIPAAILSRIFEPLFTTKRDHGTGLGLAIAHRIIERHGGEIRVTSTEGKGTTFHIRLPSAQGQEDPVVRRLPPGASLAKRVVLVEDDLYVGEGLVGLLAADDIAVRWVQLGAEAAAAIAAFEPDILVLDVGLPDMNGFDLYRRLSTRFPSLPTVFSTGHAVQVAEEFDGAPVAHLMKPYDYESLIATMNQLISRTSGT